MKYTLSLLIICGLLLSNCTGQNTTKPPVLKADELATRLEAAYRLKNSDTLDKVLMQWNKALQPDSTPLLPNDTIKAVYDVFREFYSPFDLLRLGDWEWGNKLNGGSKYAVIQDEIFFAVLTKDSVSGYQFSELTRDSIENFHPPVNLKPSQVLYSTPVYTKVINNYLGTESTKLGEGNIMNPSRPQGESEKRYDFIRPFLPILHGHWGGYWHIATHPHVGTIVFNRHLNQAEINFRVGYQGGEAFLEKKGNNWVIIKSRATWIE